MIKKVKLNIKEICKKVNVRNTLINLFYLTTLLVGVGIYLEMYLTFSINVSKISPLQLSLLIFYLGSCLLLTQEDKVKKILKFIYSKEYNYKEIRKKNKLFFIINMLFALSLFILFVFSNQVNTREANLYANLAKETDIIGIVLNLRNYISLMFIILINILSSALFWINQNKHKLARYINKKLIIFI